VRDAAFAVTFALMKNSGHNDDADHLGTGRQGAPLIDRRNANRREAIWRAVEANRANYVSTARVHELEAALMRAEREASQLRKQLNAFESSTIWGLTRPIRRMVEVAKALRGTVDPAPALPSPAFPPEDPASDAGYRQWIEAEEPAILAALLRPGASDTAVVTPVLGLVLWTDDGDGQSVAAALTATLVQIPVICPVLLVCPATTLAAARQAAVAQGRADILFQAGAAGYDGLPLALDQLGAAYLCFHHLSDQIARQAIAVVRTVLREEPQTVLLFGDEDWLSAAGVRTRPFFKPGWDPELQRGQDLVGPFGVYATAALRQIGLTGLDGPAWLYDLTGRMAAEARPDRIRHVAAVLCHRAIAPPPGHAAAMVQHAQAQLHAEGIGAVIEPVPGRPGWQRVTYALPPSEPLVSIIIATRDQPALLQACMDGILHHTAYRRFEVLIVDNGTVDPDALALLTALAQDSRVRVLRRPGSFNWSALNNDGADHAQGDILLFLNNDVAVLHPDWLDALVAQAMQPGVGVVGAKLLYPDGRVQHGGITTDRHGTPRHLLRFAGTNDPGPYGLLTMARNVWSVTGACLAVRRDLFVQVGGLNEGLPIAYNDVEFCLRLTVEGYRILWTPLAVLEHRELASRPPDHLGARREQSRRELERLHRDWGSLVFHDPFLTPHFEMTGDSLHFHRTGDGAERNPTDHPPAI
jgi:GT2 family glycosyltransferase